MDGKSVDKVFDIVEEGDLEGLQSLTREEASRGGNLLNAVDARQQNTLFHVAASCGREYIIRWLLSDDGGRALGFTNVLARNQFGLTALHLATLFGQLDCCKAIVEGCKVENGEREQILNGLSNHGESVLQSAINARQQRIIPWLLSKEEGGGRSLGFKSETVTALNRDLRSVLQEAYYSPIECVQALLSGCTAGERIKLFLTVNKKHGWTVLHEAARFGRGPMIGELLLHEEAKMIVDARDHRGMTALHRIACNGGLDKESRDEWATTVFYLPTEENVLEALLGLDPPTTTTTAATKPTVAFVDVNAGLEIPEEIKTAAAGSK